MGFCPLDMISLLNISGKKIIRVLKAKSYKTYRTIKIAVTLKSFKATSVQPQHQKSKSSATTDQWPSKQNECVSAVNYNAMFYSLGAQTCACRATLHITA